MSFVLVLCFCLASDAFASCTVTFRAAAPAVTASTAALFIVGSDPALGNWDPGKVRMDRVSPGRWKFKADFPGGKIIEYKYTLGSWDRVEKDAAGCEIENRRVAARGKNMEIKDEIGSWASGPGKRGHTITGRVDVIDDFRSKIMKNGRRVMVWLPPSYEKGGAGYPVLYMHDGQNVFDEAGSFMGEEWQADEAATRLINGKKIRDIIIVAADNAGDKRSYEYTPFRDKKRGGGGDLYCRFIVEELKPFIDGRYRTLKDRENTAICGSSLGGLISLYAAFRYPGVFSKIGVLSPAFWWGGGRIFDYVKKKELEPGAKVWLDIGTAEGDVARDGITDSVRECRRMRALLKIKGADLKYFEDEGAVHNERAWQKRFPAVLEFLFGVRSESEKAEGASK